MHNLTAQLVQSPLFQRLTEGLSWEERLQLSYERTKAVVKAYNLSAEDIRTTSPKYWEFHTDPICMVDASAGTLLTIHYNMSAGTLSMFSKERQDVAELLGDMLNFRVSGQYCLTELGHGLDAINLETTATLLPDGTFELNTPVERAAKFMPPTSPCGIPCVAIVFARLIVDSRDLGVKPFIVPLNDGREMHDGVACKILTPRGGSRPINHCLTYFHHVHLPRSALLGDIKKAADPRAEFFHNISRVIVGTLSMGCYGVASMRIAISAVARYSTRRTVIDASTGKPRSIISFSTQHTPILTAIAQVFVMDALFKHVCAIFVNPKTNMAVKHFIAASYKVTAMQHATHSILALGDRCGAQGLFEVNQLSALHADMRGASIAEGDILGISIRFAMEVILGKTKLPAYRYSDSPLVQHEQSMILELRKVMASAKSHRDPIVESHILPYCQPLMEAIGHRLGYEAARQEGVREEVINLYVASIMQRDPAWYSENTKLSRSEQFKMQTNAVTALLPELQVLLHELNVDQHVVAPITSDERWDRYVQGLETRGNIQACAPTVLPSEENRVRISQDVKECGSQRFYLSTKL